MTMTDHMIATGRRNDGRRASRHTFRTSTTSRRCGHRIMLVLAVTMTSIFGCLLRADAQIAAVEKARPVPAFDAAHRVEGSSVSFLVLGDWGTGNKSQRKVAEGLQKKFKADGAVAVLGTGDNFYPAGVLDPGDTQWQSKFEMMYPASAMPIPFWMTLGNRDMDGNPDAQIRYSRGTLRDGTTTRWNMPGRQWSERFSTKDGTVSIRVIGIDTPTLVGTNNEARNAAIAWLDSALGASTEQWKIVVGHHPVYSNGMYGNTIGMNKFVRPLLEKHGVQLYISGHDQDLQILQPEKGVNYVVCGGGGGARTVLWGDNTIFASTNLGFSWLQIGAKEILVQMLDGDGAVKFAYSIPAGLPTGQ